MEKIGTLTFHWATNYGAVLQAYALQKWLFNNNYDTEIIRYEPFTEYCFRVIEWIRERKLNCIIKELKIKKFRMDQLKLSSKRYRTNKSLFRCKNQYRGIVVGSDQIWNSSFTLYSEFKPTLSYYLNFASAETKKIAYAASIGSEAVSKEYKDIVTPWLCKFDAVSMRERSGVSITAEMGVQAQLVCDPTILLPKEEYDNLIKDKDFRTRTVFDYILHNNQTEASRIVEYINTRYNKCNTENNNTLGEYEWLYHLKHSEFVVTNSYHGMVLSTIFNTPFLAVTVPNSGMNDRINTFLGTVGLENRLVDSFDMTAIDTIISSTIDWESVNQKMKDYRSIGERFLIYNLKENRNDKNR